jgi:hypothetical protein
MWRPNCDSRQTPLIDQFVTINKIKRVWDDPKIMGEIIELALTLYKASIYTLCMKREKGHII